MRIWAIFIAILVSGCSQTSSFHQFERSAQANEAQSANLIIAPDILDAPFTREMLSNEHIFALNDSQRDEFLRYYHDRQNQDTAPHWRVANFLKNRTQNFTYEGDTFSAAEAFSRQSGNCLSLAVMSTSIAELAGLPVSYRNVHSAPMFSQDNDIQLVSTHVNLRVFDNTPVKNTAVLRPPSVTIDYFRTGRSVTGNSVSRDELVIMYWHNLASEAIVDEDYNAGFSYTMMANDIDPLHPETLNLLAILYKRKGFPQKAFEVYEFLTNNNILSYTVLENFASMLKENGEYQRAEVLMHKVALVNEDNPYKWLYAARKELTDSNYHRAKSYLLKSLELAPYLHEIHFNLAQVHARMSDKVAARDSLNDAMTLASAPEDVTRYQAKLYSLRGF